MKFIILFCFFVSIATTAFGQERDSLKTIIALKVTKFRIGTNKNFSQSELDSLNIFLLIYQNQHRKLFFGKHQKTGDLMVYGKMEYVEQIPKVDTQTGYRIDNYIFTWYWYHDDYDINWHDGNNPNPIKEKANVVLSITYINPLLNTFTAKMYLQKNDAHWYFEGYISNDD